MSTPRSPKRPRKQTTRRGRHKTRKALGAAALGALTAIAAAEPSPAGSNFGVAFEDVTAHSGIQYNGTSYGAAWGDFDGDGLPDLWASGHAPAQLYLNQGNGRFRNVALDVLEAAGDRHGAAWADFDNDGDQDLFQITGGRRGKGTNKNYLFVNRDGKLHNEADRLGVSYELGRGRTPNWFDWDQDGRLDLLLNNGRRKNVPSVLFRQGPEGFEDITQKAGLGLATGSDFALLAHLADGPTLYLLAGSPYPKLIHRVGPGYLQDVTADFDAPARHASDATVADFDNDGDQDTVAVFGSLESDVRQLSERELVMRLKVKGSQKEVRFGAEGEIRVTIGPYNNRWWKPEQIFLGQAGRHPEEMPFGLAPEAARGLARPAEPVSKGVFLGYDIDTEKWRLRVESVEGERVNVLVRANRIYGVERVGFEGYQARGRVRLLVNEPGGFVEASDRLSSEPANCFSVVSGDFDNDMDVDVYAVCSEWMTNAENLLFENRGDGSFRRVPGAAGAGGSRKGLGDAVAVADFDRDGFLDLFVSNGGDIQRPLSDGPYQLFRNLGNDNHWLEIDLEGTVSNRDGIGARVTVFTGERAQVRSQGNGTHNRAQDFRRLHFGLAGHEHVERIRIEWPSGAVQMLHDIAADQVLRIQEPRPDE